MLKKIINKIKKFIKDYVVDEDPYEKLIRYDKRGNIEKIESTFIDEKKKRGRPKKKK